MTVITDSICDARYDVFKKIIAMITMNTSIPKWVDQFGQESSAALLKLDEFYKSVSNLQYEGKVSQGRNIREIEMLIQFFNNEIMRHIKIDEQALYPFLSTHIPKLEPILRFLYSEHRELRERMKNYQQLLAGLKSRLSGQDSRDQLSRLKDEGTYLSCLMRNHFQVEQVFIYQAIDRELTASEKVSLSRKYKRLKKC